jgi:hypothetical protein
VSDLTEEDLRKTAEHVAEAINEANNWFIVHSRVNTAVPGLIHVQDWHGCKYVMMLGDDDGRPWIRVGDGTL